MDINFDIVSQILNILLQFSIAFVPILMGVYCRESYFVMKRKKRKINIRNIILSTFILSCVLVGLISYIVNKVGLTFSFTVLFLIGAFSSKLIEMVFDGSFLKIATKFITKSKGTMQESISEVLKDNDKDNKE